jgi:hypothetical protein
MPHQPTEPEALREVIHPRLNRPQAPQNLRSGRNGDVVLREIDPRLQQRDQVQQLRLQRSDPPRDAATGLLGGDSRLVDRGRVDQVADCLRLRQIDPPVQKRPQCELARHGQSRPMSQRPLNRVPQHYRRPMARDLDQILRRVRPGMLEERDHRLVDRVASLIQNVCQLRLSRPPVRGRQKSRSDLHHPRPGQTHHPQPRPSGRSGEGDDGVVNAHFSSGVAFQAGRRRSRIKQSVTRVHAGPN